MEDKNIGKKIGIYYIEDVCDTRTNCGHLRYKAKCTICGKIFEKTLSALKKPKSCKHTITNWEHKKIGTAFNNIMSRCYNKKNKDYRFYGAKGIGVCGEWLDDHKKFETWALSSGYVDGLTIDRIDPTKNYCPENCRWISLKENTRRAGRVTWIKLDGKNMTGRQWADYLKIGTNIINKAIREHGIDKTKELILAMLKEPPLNKHREPRQSWFSAYNIQL